MNPEDTTLKIKFGQIYNESGFLSLSLSINGDGTGIMHVYLQEDGKRNGQIMRLSLENYNELRKMIKKADETLKELGGNGKLRELI